MVTLKNIISSDEIGAILNTVVIDGVCVKNRTSELNIDESEIKSRIENYENIGIQTRGKLNIYCTYVKEIELKRILSGETSGFPSRAYELGNIKVYSEPEAVKEDEYIQLEFDL